MAQLSPFDREKEDTPLLKGGQLFYHSVSAKECIRTNFIIESPIVKENFYFLFAR